MEPLDALTVWNLRAIGELKGTELQWSTIEEDKGKAKAVKGKKCALCLRGYSGGPQLIEVHLDATMKPRELAACAPVTEAARNRHADILIELRCRRAAAAAKCAEDVNVNQQHFNIVDFMKASVKKATEDGRAAACGLPSAQAAAAAAFGIVSIDMVDMAWAEAIAGCGLAVGVVDSPHFRKAVALTAKCGMKLVPAGNLQLAHRTKMGSVVLPKVIKSFET